MNCGIWLWNYLSIPKFQWRNGSFLLVKWAPGTYFLLIAKQQNKEGISEDTLVDMFVPWPEITSMYRNTKEVNI